MPWCQVWPEGSQAARKWPKHSLSSDWQVLIASYSAKQNQTGVGSPPHQELAHLRPCTLWAGTNRRWQSVCRGGFGFCAQALYCSFSRHGQPLHLLQWLLFLPLSFLWFGLRRLKPHDAAILIICFWFNHRLLTLSVALPNSRLLDMEDFVFLNILQWDSQSFQKGFFNCLNSAHFSSRCEARYFWKRSLFEMPQMVYKKKRLLQHLVSVGRLALMPCYRYAVPSIYFIHSFPLHAFPWCYFLLKIAELRAKSKGEISLLW